MMPRPMIRKNIDFGLDEHKMIVEMSEAEGISQSEVVRRAVRALYERFQPRKEESRHAPRG